MLLNEVINLREYQTKSGEEIEMKRLPDSEGNDNRGWRVDKIEAYVGGEKVGYLKVSYIPHERFVRYYPDVFAFMHHIQGKRLGEYSSDYVPYVSRDKDDRRKMLKDIVFLLRAVPYGKEKEYVQKLSDREVLQQLREYDKELMDGHYGRMFKQFKNFHKDKPLVDFIRVEEPYQRQRIAEAMYRAAAEWMREKGMRLYASGTQSAEAKKAWKHLRQNVGVTKARRGRRYLEPHA